MSAPVSAPPAVRVLALPAVADLIALCVFVAIGRRSHDEGAAITGFLTTLWPFLAGAAIGWLIALGVARFRTAAFTPAAVAPAGVIVWISTVVVGMVLRVVSGQGTAVSFCIVASIATAVLLLGWRAIVLAVAKRRV